MTSLEIKPEHRKCSIPAKLKSFHGQRMRFDLDFTLTMNLVPQWFVATHQVGGVLGQFRPCQFNIREKGIVEIFKQCPYPDVGNLLIFGGYQDEWNSSNFLQEPSSNYLVPSYREHSYSPNKTYFRSALPKSESRPCNE